MKKETKICTGCNKDLPLNNFGKDLRISRKVTHRAKCKICRRIGDLESQARRNGFTSYQEERKYKESLLMKNNVFSGIYILWLGEKDLYYVGQSEHLLRRFISHKSQISSNFKTNSLTVKEFREIYDKTKIFHIRILEKCPIEILDLKEREWIIKVIIKHKEIYNKLI